MALEWGTLVAAAGEGDVQKGMNKLWGLWAWLAEEVHIFVEEHDPEDTVREIGLPDGRKRAKGEGGGEDDPHHHPQATAEDDTRSPDDGTSEGVRRSKQSAECGATMAPD